MAVLFSTDNDSNFYSLNDSDLSTDVSEDVESFEIGRCVTWVDDHNFEKVALQFPDNLLCVGDQIALAIQFRVKTATVFILADTSYGSCCVDEVAAEHVDSNAIIHFGSACLTPCTRLPVLYIFGRKPIDSDLVVEEFSKHFTDTSEHVIIVYDVIYSHAASGIFDRLKEQYPYLGLSELVIPGDEEPVSEQWFKFSGRKYRVQDHKHFDISDYVVFYVGLEGQTLRNLLMTLNRCKFVVYDPERRKLVPENINVNRALQKRYYLIERARDAHLVGILVGTLGVTGYLDVIHHIKTVAKYAGKKSYTIVVGRLNPEKLANFPEIDVFVIVACTENSIVDSKEFFRPIITPFEFEVACNEARHWTGDYVTDFTQLVPGAVHYTELKADDNEEMRTSMSLVTGKMNRLNTHPEGNDASKMSLLMTDSTVATIHNNAGGEFLLQRSWHGLEQNLGKDEAARVQQGQSGIASGYENEGK